MGSPDVSLLPSQASFYTILLTTVLRVKALKVKSVDIKL